MTKSARGISFYDSWKISRGRHIPSLASTTQTSQEAQTLPSSLLDPHGVAVAGHESWYDWWIRHQWQSQSETLLSAASGKGFEPDTDQSTLVFELWKDVWHTVTTHDAGVDRSIRGIAGHLTSTQPRWGSLDPETAENVIFAITGWQTMLYRPDFGSCPPSQLAIAEETSGHAGKVHLCLRQSRAACRKPLHDLLLGFGVLLPCRGFGALHSDEDKKALAELKSVSSTSFNAHLMMSFGRIEFRWTDSLACHLEFDAEANTLYLFRYPSFCIANLLADKRGEAPTTLRACAASQPGSHWGVEEDVMQMLEEVLLSYRLLFGQHKASRKSFRQMAPFQNLPAEGEDHVLMEICGRKTCRTGFELRERDVYDTRQDFPVLRGRFAVLMRHLSTRKPRTLRELWNDRRDSAQWLTFWAVLVVGGIATVIAFLQLVLQLVDMALDKS